jgi:hypothetical protein
MNTKNTLRAVSGILIILIAVVGAMLWSRHTGGAPTGSTTFTSKFGYAVSLPANYKTYEDKNGTVAFPTLVYETGSTTLDYHATYGANKEGISIVALIPDPSIVGMLYDAMTQNQATSTIALPQGAEFMRSNPITPSDAKSPEGAYRGMSYAFKTGRGVYILNVFSTDAKDEASRTALAQKILSSFHEIK